MIESINIGQKAPTRLIRTKITKIINSNNVYHNNI